MIRFRAPRIQLERERERERERDKSNRDKVEWTISASIIVVVTGARALGDAVGVAIALDGHVQDDQLDQGVGWRGLGNQE